MNRHDIDAVSLATGVIFLSIVASWLLGRVIDLDSATAGWFAAGTLLILGLLGLAGALRGDRGRAGPHRP
jgi:hypothetical protein